MGRRAPGRRGNTHTAPAEAHSAAPNIPNDPSSLPPEESTPVAAPVSTRLLEDVIDGLANLSVPASPAAQTTHNDSANAPHNPAILARRELVNAEPNRLREAYDHQQAAAAVNALIEPFTAHLAAKDNLSATPQMHHPSAATVVVDLTVVDVPADSPARAGSASRNATHISHDTITPNVIPNSIADSTTIHTSHNSLTSQTDDTISDQQLGESTTRKEKRRSKFKSVLLLGKRSSRVSQDDINPSQNTSTTSIVTNNDGSNQDATIDGDQTMAISSPFLATPVEASSKKRLMKRSSRAPAEQNSEEHDDNAVNEEDLDDEHGNPVKIDFIPPQSSLLGAFAERQRITTELRNAPINGPLVMLDPGDIAYQEEKLRKGAKDKADVIERNRKAKIANVNAVLQPVYTDQTQPLITAAIQGPKARPKVTGGLLGDLERAKHERELAKKMGYYNPGIGPAFSNPNSPQQNPTSPFVFTDELVQQHFANIGMQEMQLDSLRSHYLEVEREKERQRMVERSMEWGPQVPITGHQLASGAFAYPDELPSASGSAQLDSPVNNGDSQPGTGSLSPGANHRSVVIHERDLHGSDPSDLSDESDERGVESALITATRKQRKFRKNIKKKKMTSNVSDSESEMTSPKTLSPQGTPVAQPKSSNSESSDEFDTGANARSRRQRLPSDRRRVKQRDSSGTESDDPKVIRKLREPKTKEIVELEDRNGPGSDVSVDLDSNLSRSSVSGTPMVNLPMGAQPPMQYGPQQPMQFAAYPGMQIPAQGYLMQPVVPEYAPGVPMTNEQQFFLQQQFQAFLQMQAQMQQQQQMMMMQSGDVNQGIPLEYAMMQPMMMQMQMPMAYPTGMGQMTPEQYMMNMNMMMANGGNPGYLSPGVSPDGLTHSASPIEGQQPADEDLPPASANTSSQDDFAEQVRDRWSKRVSPTEANIADMSMNSTNKGNRKQVRKHGVQVKLKRQSVLPTSTNSTQSQSGKSVSKVTFATTTIGGENNSGVKSVTGEPPLLEGVSSSDDDGIDDGNSSNETDSDIEKVVNHHANKVEKRMSQIAVKGSSNAHTSIPGITQEKGKKRPTSMLKPGIGHKSTGSRSGSQIIIPESPYKEDSPQSVGFDKESGKLSLDDDGDSIVATPPKVKGSKPAPGRSRASKICTTTK